MKSLLLSPPVSKDNPGQAIRSTRGIPYLPTHSCYLFFSHPGLANDVSQRVSVHVLHHQPEFRINKVAERRKQGRGDATRTAKLACGKNPQLSLLSRPLVKEDRLKWRHSQSRLGSACSLCSLSQKGLDLNGKQRKKAVE